MQIHLKTHNDLDAVGTHVLLRASNYTEVKSVEYNDYSSIDGAITKFINDEKNYGSTLFITDICPTEGVCAELDKVHRAGNIEVYLFDHHETRAWVAKYPYATIDLDRSGTLLVYEWVFANRDLKHTLFKSDYKEFAETVTAWDLWQTDSPLRNRSEKLNNLLKFIGKNEFVQAFSGNPNADHLPEYARIIGHLERKKKSYMTSIINAQAENSVTHCDGWGNKYKVIFAADYISDLGNAILNYDKDNEIDYVCLIDPIRNSCSLRARKKDTMHVGKVAKAFYGGGGHKAASGFPFLMTENIEKALVEALDLI